MIKHLYLIVFVLLNFTILKSQNCLPNGITLSTQSDVDLFNTSYPGCTVIGGTLTINGSNVSNLDSLIHIQKIEGDLSVYSSSISDYTGLDNLDTVLMDFNSVGNSNLINFNGLDNLKYIGGYQTDIRSNSSMVDFSGLGSLQRVEGEFNVSFNSNLTSLSGINQLQRVERLSIEENNNLTDLNGLNSLDSVEYGLSIRMNLMLSSLNGLENLSYTDELELSGNDVLTDITALSNLQYADIIDISENIALTNLDGLEGIISANHSLRIRYNDLLDDISAISNLNLSGINYINIQNNPVLSVCSETSICDFIDGGGSATIQNNDTGCNGVNEIIAECCTNDPIYCPSGGTNCLPNGITLSTQSEVDLFKSTYPGCSIVGGRLYLSGSDITNLDSLINIQRIDGDLSVYSSSIIDYSGLDNLDSVMMDFNSVGNSNLINFNGLDNLTYIGGYQTDIRSNSSMVDFTGMGSLQRVEGEFSVSNNSELTSFSGISQLQRVERFYIEENDKLTDLSGLTSLDSVEYGLSIRMNPLLTSLNGLDNLSYADELELNGNDVLTDLTSLANLQYADIIDISENMALTSLDGLEGINSANHSLRIRYNDLLSDISAISNLDLSGINYINIQNNPVLSVCSETSICDFIDGGGSTTIQNNDTGCNGVNEIIAECCTNDPIYCPSGAANCLPNGITLSTQSEVDLFKSTYPGCSVVGGTLYINGSDITNLDSLINIKRIDGDLSVYSSSITDYSGLDNLDSVMMDFNSVGNGNLINFNGLDQLSYIGGYQTDIRSNSSMIDFTGMGSLQRVEGEFSVDNNADLTSFSGIGQLQRVERLNIENNNKLTDLSGLNSLDSIEYGLNIRMNPLLTSLSGLDNLSYVDELEIDENDALTDITALSNLQYADIINVTNNDVLTNLNGLGNIVSSDHSLRIRYNDQLSDISGIGNVDFSSLNYMNIQNNPLLAVCSETSICDYIDAGGSASIQNNSAGCNGVVEIGMDCDGLLYIFNNSNGFWHVDANWIIGTIPDATSYVIIPNGTSCEIQADSTANCNYLHIQANANFYVDPAATLNVFGN